MIAGVHYESLNARSRLRAAFARREAIVEATRGTDRPNVVE